VARLTSIQKVAEAKATCTQAMRCGVRKCLQSLEPDPKPGDLILGRMKWRLTLSWRSVEVLPFKALF
jgi:hypothetical protein